MGFSESVNEKLKRYYKSYYLDDLGIPNHEQRSLDRLNEEESVRGFINKAGQFSGVEFKEGVKVFVGGAGTGAELIVFNEFGCDVRGIEPNKDAIEITKAKLFEKNIDTNIIKEGCLEELPEEDNSYDFVYTWTVIEHVQDLEKSLKSLIRICKPGGVIFIATPDYRYIYEAHYKLPLPMFLPKFLVKIILRFLGRPTAFLDSLKLVTAKRLRTIFKRENVLSLQAHFPFSKEQLADKSIFAKILLFYSDKLEIQKDQYWVLRKL